jgi:KNTase C-terminal domain
MDHAARILLARRVTDFLIRRHPEAVAVWIEGSTAKGEDRIHSDLEMSMATRGESGVRSYACIFEDIVVEVDIDSEEAALRQASLVDSNWPMRADGYVRALATYDPEGLVPRLAALAGNPDPEKVSRALVSAFLGMYEDLCKVRNFAISKEEPLLRLMSMGFALHGVARFVGLLNRQYFNGFRNLLTKPREFARLPAHFWEDFPRLLAADGPAKELQERAERMHSECRELLSASGNAPAEGLSIEQALELGRLPRYG